MAVNKVMLKNGTTIMDTTGVTVTEDTLGEGATALNAAGELITGKMKKGTAGTAQSTFERVMRGQLVNIRL